ncbi:hypothetical protein [Dapis sp. BLCC M172]|uniref:hypothetical protein n=1 Tax=Dapis sp. BLCC M172 TaxID=2975281 RepID=UPI003CED7F6D
MTSLDLSQEKFNGRSNKIDPGMTLFNPNNSIIKTRGGADKLIGTDSVYGDFVGGVLVQTGAENSINYGIDSALMASVDVAAKGIDNNGVIKTGRGRDLLKGSATSSVSAVAQTVSQAIAIADTADTAAISEAFADIKLSSTADGIDNSGGEINNGQGGDGIDGSTEGSVAAVATAIADASAIVEAVAEAPVSDGLTAFAGAIAQSFSQATIIARGINNENGKITTAGGKDTITATATSSAASLSQSAASALSSGTPGNQALALSVANAFAQVKDKAIAIDNTNGEIKMGNGKDKLTGQASGSISYGIVGGEIRTGDGKDILTGQASGSKSYGIFDSHIKMGDGADTLIGEASGSDSYGVFGGKISMGDGADRVEASSFGGGVNISMGNGKDFVEGFGDAKINGGYGYDRLSLSSYNIEEFDNISFGANNNKVMFELDGITMTTKKFEEFIFGDGNTILSYNQLQDFLG